MKKYLSVIMMMAVLAMVAMTFTACGGDDDDTPGGNASVGVHRIDVQFSGKTTNFNGWTVINSFYGLKPDGSYTQLYENGKALELDARTHTWSIDEVRDMSISTGDGAVACTASISLSAPIGSSMEDVTITLVGYVNNNRIFTRSYTLPAGKDIIVVIFSTDEGGQSSCIIDREVIE